MTNEQREAIETMQHWIEYEKEHKNEINKADELIHIQEIVLSLIKEQQEKMDKKDKQIDLMAKFIENNMSEKKIINEICIKSKCNNEECHEDDLKDCIKQYFERKSEE